MEKYLNMGQSGATGREINLNVFDRSRVNFAQGGSLGGLEGEFGYREPFFVDHTCPGPFRGYWSMSIRRP